MRRAVRPATLVSIGLLALPTVGVAQETRGAVPDSVIDAYRATLLTLRDTVSHVRADLSLFDRDLRAAGDQTVVNRSRRVSRSCARLAATLDSAQSVFARRPDERVASVARELTVRMRDLARALEEHCVAGLAPQGPGARPDSLRAWGPYRSGRIQRALRAYDAAAARFANAVGLELGRQTTSGDGRRSPSASQT